MIVKNKAKSETLPVSGEDIEKVKMVVLIGEDEGAPNFYMRRFDLEAGGHTPYHTHNWEHVVYILEGSGVLKGIDGDRKLEAGSSVFVAPNEEHQFRADEGSPLSFLCSIPKP